MNIKNLKSIIEEAYAEVLQESLLTQLRHLDEAEEEEAPEDLEDPTAAPADPGAGDESGIGTFNPSSTPAEESNPQELLGMKKLMIRFPTLEVAITRLQTEEYKSFVDSIDWISPRPTTFKVNLKNGQDYLLKWLGSGFEAQIMGKRYYVNNIAEYQQALDKLGILYNEAPFKNLDEEEPAEPVDTSGGGGGGEFPGDEGGGGAEADAEFDSGEEGGGGDAPEPADLEGEPIDFESGTEPEK